jgi:Rrf2 family transcriptional regulator, nitric oxide-sensitive transcriptional repressor
MFTDLALRIVMRLGVLGDDDHMTTASVASQLAVRHTHAAKVVTTLQKLGLIETRRGRTGGLRLAKGASEVSIGFLVRKLEGLDEVVNCEGAVPCPLRHGCRLRTALRQAQEAFLATLDPLTIADVTATPTRSLLLSLTGSPRS